MEVNLEIAPGCYIHNVFFVVVVPVNIKTGCNSFAVLRNRVVYIYTCWNPQVTWEQIKVGQAALVVPNSHYWNVEGKKKEKKKKMCHVKGLFLSRHMRTAVWKQLVSFLQVWLTVYLMFKPLGLKATGDDTN